MARCTETPSSHRKPSMVDQCRRFHDSMELPLECSFRNGARGACYRAVLIGDGGEGWTEVR